MMIPQKFLMMKCVRILFLLHVVGIVFVAYKIYSSTVSQSGATSGTARDYFNRKPGGNLSSSKNVLTTDAANKVKADEFKIDPEYTDVDDESINIPKNDDDNNNDEFETETVKEVNDDDDDDNDIVTGEITQRDQSKQNKVDYQTRNANKKKGESLAGNRVVSMQSSKSNVPNVAFKKEPSQSLAGPPASLRLPHWTLLYAGKYSKSLYSPPANEKAIQRLPRALVIGSPNSGIRPLVDFLEIHPQIVPVKRETSFFDNQNRLQFFSIDFLSQMPLSYSNQVTVVRTSFSHWTRKSICDLYLRNKMLKVIVVLRDPVSRILSQITTSNDGRTRQLVVAQHGETLKINNNTETVEWGRYAEYLKMWTQCFPRSQIHIVEWSDIMQRPSLTVHIIEGFLGVPYKLKADNFFRDEARRVYCIRPLHTKSRTCLSEKRGKIPELSPQEEALIYKFYSKHNEELFKLLGQRYQWGPYTS